MRWICATALAAVTCVASGCAAKGGDGEQQTTDPAFEEVAGCAAERLPEFGELLHKVFVCLHSVDTNSSHPGCAWTPVPCTPDPAANPPVACPDGAGGFTFVVGYGTIGAKIRPGLLGAGPSYSECWNGMGSSESCAVEWHTVAPSTITGSGDMGFVELSPDSHVFTLALAEPVLEANGCVLRVTNLGVYLHLGNLEAQQGPVIYSAQMGFEATSPGITEVLTGFTVFGDTGTTDVDLVFRGVTRQASFDAATFELTW